MMPHENRARLLDELRAMPRRLDAALQAVPRTVLTWTPAPGKWSILEIVCHLRDMERDAYLERYRKILAGGSPLLPWCDPDAIALERRYREQRFAEALRDWKRLRRECVALLETLVDEQWEMSGLHSTKGSITVAQLLEQQVHGDDAVHLRQIGAIKERHACLTRLEDARRALHDLLDGQPAGVLEQRTVAEPLALLRDFEQLMLERYAKILEQDHPEMRAQDAMALAARVRTLEIDAPMAWREFLRSRAQTLQLLHALGPRMWQRRAVHPRRGDISMADLVARHLDHDAEMLQALRASLSPPGASTGAVRSLLDGSVGPG